MGAVNPAAVITDEWLRARTKPVGDCLVWQLSAAHGTQPTTKIGGRKGPMVLVRRVLWQRKHGQSMPRHVLAGVSCGTPLCVHEDHIVAIDRKELPDPAPEPPLNPQLLHAIGEADEPNEVLAARIRSTEAGVAALRLASAWRAPIHHHAVGA